MYRSPKVISEDIDDAQLEFAKYEKEARSILANCKAAGRDINDTEQRRFDILCGTAGSRNGLVQQQKQRISQLQNELRQTHDNQRQIAMSAHPSGMVYGNQLQDDLVLPLNGILPGDQPRRYKPFNRIGKLAAFRDEQVAFDCGQWTKAIVSRLYGGMVDKRAEDYCAKIGLEIENVAMESGGTAGGYLVPGPLANTIIDVRERVGVARQSLSIMPATSDTLSVPRKAAG